MTKLSLARDIFTCLKDTSCGYFTRGCITLGAAPCGGAPHPSAASTWSNVEHTPTGDPGGRAITSVTHARTAVTAAL
ncbi:hypothetical protein E2C01_093786 [Portunus trituberculatus]|uniref:Uncharacterized protein n=1 Tax=Portunus trituberculatus TaxID=210409 RepID=A0A5B7JVS4_PORTR|nr:hypothetical protein [Portunus trituberculatus]